ncbi:MAG: reverse transcriptase/maturase family protein [Patescibacteria group bacterium]
MQLSKELKSGTYRHDEYNRFYVRDPKFRSIHKATVRDRIVHQAIYSALCPLFDRQFFFDSYSCRLGKGTQAAISRIWDFLRQESKSFSREVYVFHGDVANFFGSVDHQILLSLIRRQVKDPQYIRLCRTIINSFSGEAGSGSAGDVSPRLRGSDSRSGGRGIPLGNLTSQVFANIYLHEFDYFMKQVCDIRCYARYNDDFYIVSANKNHLIEVSQKAKDFLRTRLHLTLPDEKIIIRSLSQGVDMLGAVAFPYGLVPRIRLRRASLAVAGDAASQGYQSLVGKQLASYIGLLAQLKSYNLREKLRLSLGLNTDYV